MLNGRHWCMIAHTDADHSVWLSAEAETEENAKARAIEKWNTRHYPPEVQQAVERMKPKKVLNIQELDIACFIGNCPTCNAVVITYEDKHHCDLCGQRLEWREE